MFFKKFFVSVLLVLGLNNQIAFAEELTASEKLSHTAQYLCTNVSNKLCNMNEAYVALNDYHKKLLKQVNGHNLSIMEETLPMEIQEALNDLENVTDVYDMRQILLTAIKFSKYYDASILFYNTALSKLDAEMEQDPIWQSSVSNYEQLVKVYNLTYSDPYRDSVISWTELGRDFVDSAKYMKADADTSISISKATFLYPYVKSTEIALKYTDTVDTIKNIEVGYKVATELLPMLKSLIPKLYDSTYTHDDLFDLLNKCNGIIVTFDHDYGNSKPVKVIAVIAQISKFITISKQEAAFTRLYTVYQDNIFTKYTLSILRNLLDSKMMLSALNTIKIINGLLPSGTGHVDDFIDVGNNLAKAFLDYELKLRKVLHKTSLNGEYLKLYLSRTSISEQLYSRFMFNYFRKHTADIVDVKAFDLDTIPEEQENNNSTLQITLPQGAMLNGYKLSATQGSTISFQGMLSAKNLRGCIHDAGDAATYTLWYIDIDGKRKSLPLSFESFNQTFSFAMPSSQITMVDLAYDKNIEDDYYGSGFCGLPTVWESTISTDDGNSTGGDANTTFTHPLKQTGQTISYYAGDDASYRAGVAPSYTRSEAGVVTDNVTGLEWQDDYSDNNGNIMFSNWQGAIYYCGGLGLDGGGWRLPDIEELETIIDSGRHNPAIDATFRTADSSIFLSSTTYDKKARHVDFYYGNSFFDYNVNTNHYYVRCVRGGQ